MATNDQNALDIAVLRQRVDAMEQSFKDMKDAAKQIASDVSAIRENIAVNHGIMRFANRAISFVTGVAGVAVGYFTAKH